MLHYITIIVLCDKEHVYSYIKKIKKRFIAKHRKYLLTWQTIVTDVKRVNNTSIVLVLIFFKDYINKTVEFSIINISRLLVKPLFRPYSVFILL